jgi:hypothetical protein
MGNPHELKTCKSRHKSLPAVYFFDHTALTYKLFLIKFNPFENC